MKSVLSLPNLIKLSMKFQTPIYAPNSQLLASGHRPPHVQVRRGYFHDISEEGQDALNVNPSAIRTFLTTQNIDFKQGFTCYSAACTQCRKCQNPTAKKAKIFINSATGSFNCSECTWSGTWKQFEAVVDAFQHGDPADSEKNAVHSRLRGLDDASEAAEEERRLTHCLTSLSAAEFADLVKLHQIQGLKMSTLMELGVQVYSNKRDLFFPRYHSNQNQCCGYKRMIVRELPEETVITEQIFPKEAGVLGLFGWNLIPKKATELVITSNEFDAMIIRQETGKPVVALPKGISLLPVEALPLLEQFSKIVLWLDGSGNRSWQAAKIFSRKLDEKRCHLVSPELCPTRALNAFQSGTEVNGIILKARPVSHKSVVTFGSFRSDVLNELTNREDFSGLRWQRFPALNRILKGHRRGELTVLTGPTGSGKTTFLSEYSLDLCNQGLRTLWGSFEIKNSRLAKTMLNQFARKSMQKNVTEFDLWADKFEQLALYFMAFHGQETLDNVFEAMLHAVYVHDIEHVIVDNLQFMMGATNFKTIHDRIVKQDQLIEGFRKFSTSHDCHVTLVVHPRKEMEGQELTAQSIYGGAKASQEADNILILQNNRGKSGLLQGKKYIEIVKNRYDGDLGIVPLSYDKDSQSYVKKERAKGDNTVGATTTKKTGKAAAAFAAAKPSTFTGAATDGATEDEDEDQSLTNRIVI
ncbi:Twinkle protein, mitochondrial [Hypsibius exemplaris]|uniref:DNA 5'-3' helicase n=1 Tax=Hypsibius exemplaris TaxID=2072580 RepID=A0A1W0WSW8_HYPEX|nr:Twinkle protein, mitochondrial [Hypsibius exemplaris]